MAVRDIILTEKSVRLANEGKFTFIVDRDSSLEQIKDEIQKIYNVHIVSMNSANMPAKKRGRGKYLGKKSSYKKVIVTLKKGEKIQAFIIETEDKKDKKAQEPSKVAKVAKEEKVKGQEVKADKQFARKAI